MNATPTQHKGQIYRHLMVNEDPVINPRRHGLPPKGIPFLPRVRQIKAETFDLAKVEAEFEAQKWRLVEATKKMTDEREKFLMIAQSIDRYHGVYKVVAFRQRGCK